MRTTMIAAAALAAVDLAGAPADAGVRLHQVVRGRMLPVDDASDAYGAFRMLVKTNGRAQREYLYVDAWGLDVTRDDGGALPDYHVFLVNADASAEADFGECFLRSRGRARLRFHSAREDFPEGVETLKDFAGGTVELRLGADVILTGDVPEFIGIDDGNSRGSHAAAKARGAARLRRTEAGGRAKGVLECLYVNRPAVQVEALRIECIQLGHKGDDFTVVCIDGGGTETTVGTMTARTRLGIAVLALSSRRGDTIPGGGVLGLAGQTVEVRDAGGTAFLTGTFPTLASE